MRILLVRLRQIGDVVFTTPAIRALRRRFPDARLTYIVEPGAAPAVLTNPHLNEVIVAPRRRGIRGLFDDLALGSRLRAEGFDLAIDFHGGPRASLLTWLSGAPQRLGYRIAGRSWMYSQRVARPKQLRARHSVENQWDLLIPLGIAPPDRSRDSVEMRPDADAAAVVLRRLTDAGLAREHQLIVMHVSAGNPFRRWPAAHFVELATALATASSNHRVLITSGPSEGEAAGRIIADARRNLGDLRARQVLSCGEFSLSELRALLEHAVLYVGGDSGPLHIAATTGVPIVGLYGPTLPARSAPWRDVSLVTESVDAGELPCRPCDQRVCAPGDFRCLTTITTVQVMNACVRALTRAENRHSDGTA